jgi:DNA-binding response OmpR family regulator
VGFETVEADDGDRARRLLAERTPDLVVLDIMLPGTDGLALCTWIRARSAVPVILLTARGDEEDRIVGLELGADDYVTKPFSPRELISRVRAVLRRVEAPYTPNERIAVGDLQIDAEKREVRRAGEELRLTAKEFELLWLLATHPRKVFARDELMRQIWGYEAAFDTGTVTVHVRRLREKVEQTPSEPRHLQTVWGVGYRFVP